MTHSIAVHGGAGLIRRHALSPAREQEARDALHEALQAGDRVLAAGGDAVEAVLRAVCVLEDAPVFNAGRGAVFAADGTIRMDAAVMSGADRSAGAVGAVQRLRHPIRAADLVRRTTPHVLLVGADAEERVVAAGAERCTDEELFVQERWDHFVRARAEGRVALDHDLDDAEPKGTVGAVARDAHGHVAAATSTGGLANKHPARVGDTPIVGAGTWAWDHTCAVSATGHGEAMMRCCAAARVSALMELAGLDLAAATARVVHEELPLLGGTGGLIAVDARTGRIALPFNSGGMYRGSLDTEGNLHIAIW
ncbi:MAG: isoaspartyl peptidase/L-asparaginase [Alphaproteobacteria bacterium]|nr:isoaspartyl peptidase/L-asparaginase [Alphaproteobacteria bacterium]